jgi:hypothetical protein
MIVGSKHGLQQVQAVAHDHRMPLMIVQAHHVTVVSQLSRSQATMCDKAYLPCDACLLQHRLCLRLEVIHWAQDPHYMTIRVPAGPGRVNHLEQVSWCMASNSCCLPGHLVTSEQQPPGNLPHPTPPPPGTHLDPRAHPSTRSRNLCPTSRPASRVRSLTYGMRES